MRLPADRLRHSAAFAALRALALALILAPALSGCVADRIMDWSTTEEALVPKSAIIAADGSMAICADATLNGTALWSGAKVAAKDFGGRRRYLILSPNVLKQEIREALAKQSAARQDSGPSPLQVRIDSLRAYLGREGYRIIPPGLEDPPAAPEQLPEEFRGPGAKEVALSSPILYTWKEGQAEIEFKVTEIPTGRDKTS